MILQVCKILDLKYEAKGKRLIKKNIFCPRTYDRKRKYVKNGKNEEVHFQNLRVEINGEKETSLLHLLYE